MRERIVVPAVLTTVVLGGGPLMLGSGSGSEIHQPLGYSVVGGLLSPSSRHRSSISTIAKSPSRAMATGLRVSRGSWPAAHDYALKRCEYRGQRKADETH